MERRSGGRSLIWSQLSGNPSSSATQRTSGAEESLSPSPGPHLCGGNAGSHRIVGELIEMGGVFILHGF